VLTCKNPSFPPVSSWVWYKNGQEVSAVAWCCFSPPAYPASQQRGGGPHPIRTGCFCVAASVPRHGGLRSWQASGSPHAGTALRAVCPSPSLQPIVNGSGRYIIKSSGNKTELRILKLSIEEDAGDYHCNATNSDGFGGATVNLRVRSRLAALWPFLGIVAEVLVLVTIIFIYEKRRKPDEVLDGKKCLGLNLSGETK